MTPAIETGAELKTCVLRSVDQVRAIAAEWRDLFRRAHATAFQSPDWLLPWIEVFYPQKILLVEVRCADRLMAVAPLLIYRRGEEHVLAFMGGGVSDYLDVLIDPGYEQVALAEILGALLDVPKDWTLLELTDLPRQSLLLKLPPLQHSVSEHDSCSVLHLPATEDELLHVFSKRQRANLRNARSRLQHAGGGSIETATAQNVSEFLDDLFALHTTRWSGRGEAGVLADERIRRFHLTCASELLKEGLLHLSRLRLGHRTLAIIYSLFSQQTAFCYLQGFDPEFAPLSPGTQLMYSVICDALSRGMREFDFLRGEEDYKQHWRPERRSTYRIQITRSELSAELSSNTRLAA